MIALQLKCLIFWRAWVLLAYIDGVEIAARESRTTCKVNIYKDKWNRNI
jgi:hypothetical protein